MLGRYHKICSRKCVYYIDIDPHFILNTVNFENGKKYQVKIQDLEKSKQKSSKLGRKHGLTISAKGEKITTFNQGKYRAIEKDFIKKEKVISSIVYNKIKVCFTLINVLQKINISLHGSTNFNITFML